jgi:hypothetical protein
MYVNIRELTQEIKLNSRERIFILNLSAVYPKLVRRSIRKDGLLWIPLTLKQISAEEGCGRTTVCAMLKRLSCIGIIYKEKLSSNPYDHTLFYAINPVFLVQSRFKEIKEEYSMIPETRCPEVGQTNLPNLLCDYTSKEDKSTVVYKTGHRDLGISKLKSPIVRNQNNQDSGRRFPQIRKTDHRGLEDLTPDSPIVQKPDEHNKDSISIIYTSPNTSPNKSLYNKLKKFKIKTKCNESNVDEDVVPRKSTNTTAQDALAIWNLELERNDHLTLDVARFLVAAIRDKFSNSIYRWNEFVRSIRRSVFLMSEKCRGWFNLKWVLIYKNMNRLLKGELGVKVDDLEKNEVKSVEKVSEEIYDLREDAECLALRSYILEKYGAPMYSSWLKDVQLQSRDQCIFILAPSNFVLDHLRSNFCELSDCDGGVF